MEGGFLPTTSSYPEKKPFGVDEQTIRPATIKQIIEAEQSSPDDAFLIDKVPVGQISFVGVVFSVTSAPTSVTYQIEDGTGTLELKKWTKMNDADSTGGLNNEDQAAAPFDVGTYIYAVGRLKQFNNKFTVNSLHEEKIQDMNQVIYHYISAIRAHVLLTGKSRKNDAPSSSLAGQTDELFASSNSVTDPVQKRILDIISRHNGDPGIPVAQIAKLAQVSLQDAEIEVRNLEESGKIYSADDLHYLPL